MVPRFRDYLEMRSNDRELLAAVTSLTRRGISPWAVLEYVHMHGFSVQDAVHLAEMGPPGAAPAAPGAGPAQGTPPGQVPGGAKPNDPVAAAQALMSQLARDPNAVKQLQTILAAAKINVPAGGQAPSATPPPAAPAAPKPGVPQQPGQQPAKPGQPQAAPAANAQPAAAGAQPAAPQGQVQPGQTAPPNQPKKPGQV